METAEKPLVSVVVYVRIEPPTLGATLDSLRKQTRFDDIEVLVADGSPGGISAETVSRFPWIRRLERPQAGMFALKALGIKAAKSDIVAVLDPVDIAAPDWIEEILTGLSDETVSAVGGSVVVGGRTNSADRACYIFEYGSFNPPVPAGVTLADLPGNNVAYRRKMLVDGCADVLDAEGFNKPFCHVRIRELGGKLVIRPGMRVTHMTSYRFLPMAWRRFHFGRCFGATRWKRSDIIHRLLYTLFAPVVPALLAFRHIFRALAHTANRRLLYGSFFPLVGICLYWGVGEWLGYWTGAGRSCQEVY